MPDGGQQLSSDGPHRRLMSEEVADRPLATRQGTATGVPAITDMELSKPRVKPTSDLQSQALRVGDISPHEDTGAVIYNCDPQANRRAIVRVNELCKLRLWKGTREEAIEAAWRELDNAIRSWPSGSSGRRRTANKRRSRRG